MNIKLLFSFLIFLLLNFSLKAQNFYAYAASMGFASDEAYNHDYSNYWKVKKETVTISWDAIIGKKISVIRKDDSKFSRTYTDIKLIQKGSDSGKAEDGGDYYLYTAKLDGEEYKIFKKNFDDGDFLFVISGRLQGQRFLCKRLE